MTPDLWMHVKEIVQEALERAPDTRAAFVAGACRDDHDLRGEVESLLAAHERAGTFIDAPLSPAAAARIVSELERSGHKLQHGDRLGPYEIVDALGAGGMGEVYRARDTKLRREVAIKVLPPSVAHDPERLRRFEREAHLLASLNHPHIAAIYGLEESAGITALVLELVEGITLADRIAAGPVPVEEALAIARQIAEALEAAHERSIIHRDLKPANVKLTPDGTVKTPSTQKPL